MWELYKRKDRRWAWRLVALNGDVLAVDGGQGYERRVDALAIMERVRAGAYADLPVQSKGGVL